MMSARLRYRVPSCAMIGLARLPRYQLRFNKRSIDKSGKCNAVYTGNERDEIIGVVYEIPENEKPKLDRAEGLGNGYHEERLRVILSNDSSIEVRTYVADATRIDNSLKPYTWYKEFVVSGALEQGLPAEYISTHIEPVATTIDPDQQREKDRRAELVHS